MLSAYAGALGAERWIVATLEPARTPRRLPPPRCCLCYLPYPLLFLCSRPDSTSTPPCALHVHVPLLCKTMLVGPSSAYHQPHATFTAMLPPPPPQPHCSTPPSVPSLLSRHARLAAAEGGQRGQLGLLAPVSQRPAGHHRLLRAAAAGVLRGERVAAVCVSSASGQSAAGAGAGGQRDGWRVGRQCEWWSRRAGQAAADGERQRVRRAAERNELTRLSDAAETRANGSHRSRYGRIAALVHLPCTHNSHYSIGHRTVTVARRQQTTHSAYVLKDSKEGE